MLGLGPSQSFHPAVFGKGPHSYGREGWGGGGGGHNVRESVLPWPLTQTQTIQAAV